MSFRSAKHWFCFHVSDKWNYVAEIDLIAYENYLNCEHYTIQNVIMAFNCSSFVLLINHVFSYFSSYMQSEG